VEASHLYQKSPLLLNCQHVEKVLTIFLRDELHKTGLGKAVIGLSGGVDSALSTYLAVRALGRENVHVVLMPYRTSTSESVDDAMTVVQALNISHEIFGITPVADPFFEETEREGAQMDRRRRGNVLARIRMIALYDRSQAMEALVIGTSNKTESLLGYTTLFGDNASAINPLGDLYKAQVWQLAKHLGIPEAIVNKPPTADLWPGQTDEQELGVSYAKVDEILFYMIDMREGDEKLKARGFEQEFIERIREKVRRSQFKRKLPVIAKISGRTIETDFRYPRDWGT
jgi:NAD+ synthase